MNNMTKEKNCVIKTNNVTDVIYMTAYFGKVWQCQVLFLIAGNGRQVLKGVVVFGFICNVSQKS